MSEFNFNVGDEITCASWGDQIEIITAIGKTYFLSINEDGIEDYWSKNCRDWFKPKPKKNNIDIIEIAKSIVDDRNENDKVHCYISKMRMAIKKYDEEPKTKIEGAK